MADAYHVNSLMLSLYDTKIKLNNLIEEYRAKLPEKGSLELNNPAAVHYMAIDTLKNVNTMLSVIQLQLRQSCNLANEVVE